MTTCIKCRQQYSEDDHECMEEMTVDEVMAPKPRPRRRSVFRDLQAALVAGTVMYAVSKIFPGGPLCVGLHGRSRCSLCGWEP